MGDKFLQQKNDVLSKMDKSSKGSWDKRVIELCEVINDSENYYTTSSCSGRIVFIIDSDKKGSGLFLSVFHDLVDFEGMKSVIEGLDLSKNVKFKQEPFILHVICRGFEDAVYLLERVKDIGFKKSGIISVGQKFVVEINGTERLEFPVIYGGNVLIDDDFLRVIVEKSNENLNKSWERIERLIKVFK